MPDRESQAAQTGAVAVAALVFVVGGLAWVFHLVQQGPTHPDSRPQQTPPASQPTTLPPSPLAIAPGPWPTPEQLLGRGPAPPLSLPLRVNQAIDRALANLRPGSFYPKAYQNWLGLQGLTLLECDVPRDDPGVRLIADLVRSQRDLDRTYELSLAILFLDRLGDPNDEGLIRTFARRLLEGQNRSGLWGYYGPNWSGDNSCTQFAVLGLWVAQRHGVSVSKALRLAAQHFRESQQDDGSWTYAGPSGSKHSMTCAGLFCLAAERGASPGYVRNSSPREATVVSDPAITRGFRFLAKACDGIAKGDAIDAPSRMYFLWSLERVAAICGLEKIGSREWYPWTVELVLQKEEEYGGFRDELPGPVIGTCFALLVLRRSNLTPDLLVRVPGTTQPLVQEPSLRVPTSQPDLRIKPGADRIAVPPAERVPDPPNRLNRTDQKKD